MDSKLYVLPWLLLFSVTGITQVSKLTAPYAPVKWVIANSCTLRVAGSTNVNKFCCEITGYNKPDTLLIYTDAGKDQPLPVKGMMDLDVGSFDCHNTIMTNDLRKTLKAATFPLLHIRFVSLSRFPDLRLLQDTITGVVNIELAGVSRYYEVKYKFSSTGQQAIRLLGERVVSFSDFQLTPPRKLGGMIQTKDRLDIEFTLYLKVISANQ